MQRRDFVSSVSAGAVGALVIPRGIHVARGTGRLVAQLPILAWVGKFALGVGIAVTTRLINQYLTNRSERLKERINRTNDMMAAPGQDFSDLSRSHVFESNDGSFFYVAVRNRPDDPEDDFNACCPFCDPVYVRPPRPAAPVDPTEERADDPMDDLLSREVITLMEGPSLVAIGGAAEALAASTSTARARAVLQPRVGIRRSIGSFQSGYVEPDEYETEEAKITIDYESDGSGTGLVEIVARHRISGTRMFGERMEVTYPVA